MSEPSTKTAAQPGSAAGKKPGFFGRLVRKLDESMKAKAKAKSSGGGCCGGGDGKGGKCC